MKPSTRRPLKTSYMGYEIHGQRTWTQAAVLMQALNILENFNLREMGHNSTAYIHTISQAINLAFADREAYYGDPDFAVVPVDGLLSKEYARERAAMIDPSKCVPGVAAAWRSMAVLVDVRCARTGAGTSGGLKRRRIPDLRAARRTYRR